ncbi:MAG: hypothetical protein MK297_02130 [Planctomycetes bacterium]|nr:hypothetical protein [Planctomycetota bacterium]
MKWTTRILFLLAISLSAALVAMVSGQKTRTPEATLEAIEATIGRDDFNHEAILRSLDGALSNARATGETELQAKALSLRGDVLYKIGAYEDSIRDFDEVSALQGSPDEELLIKMAEAHVRAGDPESGQRRIETLLSVNPESAPGLVQQGRLHQSSAEKLTDECEEAMSQIMPHAEAERAATIVDRLTAQDLLDPRRAGQVSTLREFFTEADGERLTRILVLCDDASVYNRKARDSYERSFEYSADPLGAYEYITLLMRAQRPEHALRFGAQVRKHRPVLGHHPTTLQLIRAHVAAGDGAGAGTLAAELIQATRDLTPEEYAVCCRALQMSSRWSGLFYAGNRMKSVGTAADGLEASLYLGLAQLGRKRYTNARALLRTYASSGAPEPYEGALYEAWTLLAELDRAAGEDFMERESVYAALQIDPDGTGASALWIRLAELQEESGHTGLLVPLRSLAEALCRQPKDYNQLFARYKELGARALSVEGRDLDLIYQDVTRERRSLPLVPLDSYSLLDLAQRHRTDENHLAAISVCRRILENLPNFTPAIDLMIDSRLTLGRIRTATDQIADRIDLVGLDETSKGFVRRLPVSPFSEAQLHRIMRADPAWTGRLEIAKRLRAEGARRQALVALEKAEGIEASAETTLLSAQIYAELQERKLALEKLASIKSGDPLYSEALLTAVEIASLAGKPGAIDEAIEGLLATGDVATLKTLANKLVFDRRLQKAMPVFEEIRKLTGGADAWSLEQEILLHLVQGSASRAKDAASRAEAFTLSPIPPLGMVLASTISGDQDALARESRYLLDSLGTFTSSGGRAWRAQIEGGVGEAILALFAGDYERVLSIAALTADDTRHLPEWAVIAAGLESVGSGSDASLVDEAALAQAKALLHGTPEDPRQPARVLGVLLAAQTSYFAPYSLEQLNQFTGEERTAWDAYLIAKTLDKGSQTLRARDALWSWVQKDAPLFEPAWELFEQLERKRIGHYDHETFDALRAAKAFVTARKYPSDLTRSIARCYQNLQQGDIPAAVGTARTAQELDPASYEANAALAHAMLLSGESGGSTPYWIRACEAAPPSHRPRLVTGALKSMEQALQSSESEVLPSVQSGALQELAKFAGQDPRIPIAIARLDLLEQAENPALGVARAFRRLDNFLRAAGDVGLADLHSGTERAWLEFYLQYGPEQALEFCREQLKLSPGVQSLWLGEVRALSALGRYKEALAAAKDLMRMSPTGALYEEVAHCLQASGASARDVEDQLRKAQRLSDGLSLNAKLTRAKSLLSVKGERTASQAITVLAKAWPAQKRGPLDDTTSEVGLLISEGLMKRARDRDYQQALQLLTAVKERGATPYDRSLANALRGLCSQLNS